MSSITEYPHGPDSERKAGVPRGNVSHFQHVSAVFPGARRDYWVYVPQQYDPSTPAAVMIFQDGHLYVCPFGNFMSSSKIYFGLTFHREQDLLMDRWISPTVI